MFGAEIPDGLLFGLIPISFTMVVALIAYIVREIGRIANMTTRLEERSEDLERRVTTLEDRRYRSGR